MGVTEMEYFAPPSSPVNKIDSSAEVTESFAPVLRLTKSIRYELGLLPLRECKQGKVEKKLDRKNVVLLTR